MPDYRKALRDGLKSAEDLARVKSEIAQIWKNFVKELSEETDGRININIKKEIEQETGLFAAPLLGRQHRTYLAIVAENPKSKNKLEKELARWEQERTGYPCRIIFGDVQLRCDDAGALESALVQLLRDPIVGEKLHALMKQE